MSGKGPPRELGYVGADTGGQPGQAGDALDAEFSRSLPGSCATTLRPPGSSVKLTSPRILREADVPRILHEANTPPLPRRILHDATSPRILRDASAPSAPLPRPADTVI